MKSTYVFLGLIVLVGAFYAGRYLYFKPKHIKGESAPVFKGQMLDGKEFDLESMKGNYVLLDFWGSWCGPCIREFPKVKAMHSKYNGKKFKNGEEFHVVSVAIEQNDKRWQSAIQKHGLSWPYHVLDMASSLRFFDSPIAKQYGVKEVPTKFLINPRGEIIGVNLPFEEMMKMLDDRF